MIQIENRDIIIILILVTFIQSDNKRYWLYDKDANLMYNYVNPISTKDYINFANFNYLNVIKYRGI